MKTNFYDIESLKNVYTLANFKCEENHLDIFYLIDNPQDIMPDNFEEQATARIYEKNKNFNGTVAYHDLKKPESNILLAKTFGLSDATYTNNADNKSSYGSEYRIVCDTDPEYNEDDYPYLLGYNSFHYDTTMHTLYMFDTFRMKDGQLTIDPPTAETMRGYNDELFEFFNDENHNMEDRLKVEYVDALHPKKGFTKPDFRATPAVIRKNMLMSGRHLDVARLNEKQSKVALKRILGFLGYQILESDKLRPGQNLIESADQLLDLIAYNVSDVVNLAKLFLHKTYQSSFELKRQLLKTYPELIYKEDDGTYKPEISPKTVRNDRLTIDSSSAQFATKSLCPYGHLHDYDTVSFMYPSPKKARDLGIKRVNVLEEAKTFFYKNFQQPELRAKFDEIYNYYKSIEGKNFNSSKNYLEDHNIDAEMENPEYILKNYPDETAEPDENGDFPTIDLTPQNLSAIPAPNTCMFYYNKDGSPSTCFVNFSTGGIHGAEFNKALYEGDLKKYEAAMAEWNDKVSVFNTVMSIYPNPWDLKLNKGIEINGVKYKPSDFLKPKATETAAFYKDLPKQPNKPSPFKQSPKGGWNLDKRYTFTSADPTQHEDFTSYYPNMLRMMDAFYNEGLGYDRYGEIFDDKTKYGKMMKDEQYSKDERELYSVMRNGTKLILNSASGAGDAGFESNVRMNNKIISMRIIGQLFTWRIGQAQTLEGASIISTNTDGLYSARLEEEVNNRILARESADINVEIEPEPIYLISKDSNNRAEIKIKDGDLGDVAAANGSNLSCRKGPTPTQNLAHPAIIDWALCEYLTVASIGYKGLSLTAPFDYDMGRSILQSARGKFNDDTQTLIMFQDIIASSPSSDRYVFATTDDDPTTPIPLQHYNRCFFVKDKTPGTVHMKVAAAKVVTDAQIKKRQKENERPQQHDPMALEILAVNGMTMASIPANKEAQVTKITGVDDSWYILTDNSDLYMMPDENKQRILDALDYDKYLTLLEDSYANNWRNMTPEWEQKEAEAKANKKKAHNLFEDDDASASTPPANNADIDKIDANMKKLVASTDNNVNLCEDAPLEVPEGTLLIQDTSELFPDQEELVITFSDEAQKQTILDPVKAEDDRQKTLIQAANAVQNITEQIQSYSADVDSRKSPDGTPDAIDLPPGEDGGLVPEDINEGPLPISEIGLPKMTQLNRTVLSETDIKNAEKCLAMNGIREIDTHKVLKLVLKTLTNTDID